MTEKQFEEYRKTKKEVDEIKDFLGWCGKKYKFHGTSLFQTRVIGRKASISVGRKGYGAIGNTEILLPKELQESIIDLIEQYVERREKEMEEI